MFSNDRLIELNFHYFYIVFYHYWFIELQFNRYKLLLFLRLFINKVLFFGVLVFLILNRLQFLRSIIILLMVYFCLSYLLGQCSLILKVFLGCDCKFRVVSIQTVPTDLLLPKSCGRSWQGWQFLRLHISQSIHWLDSRQFFKLIMFEVV